MTQGDLHGVAELFLQISPQSQNHALLHLPGPLAADAPAIAEILQGDRLVGDQTLAEDLGLLAGGRDGLGARLCSRAIDLALSLPRVVVLLVLVAATGTLGPLALAAVLGLTGWPAIARLTRGEAERLRHAPYVLAARTLGASPRRQLLAHVLPGTLPAALIAATLGVADVLLLEAGLSYLGIGVQPPTPTWGNMILEAQGHLATAPRLLLIPALALVTATAAATLLGDALRARLSPHRR